MAFQTRGTITTVHQPSDYDDCMHHDGGALSPRSSATERIISRSETGPCGSRTITVGCARHLRPLRRCACSSEAECGDDDTASEFFLAQHTRRQRARLLHNVRICLYQCTCHFSSVSMYLRVTEECAWPPGECRAKVEGTRAAVEQYQRELRSKALERGWQDPRPELWEKERNERALKYEAEDAATAAAEEEKKLPYVSGRGRARLS